MTKPAPLATASLPPSLRAVDRAIADLRRGGFVVLLGEEGQAGLMQAAEGVTGWSLLGLEQLAGALPLLALSGRRAAALGLGHAEEPALTLSLEAMSAEMVHDLADPLAGQPATPLRPQSVNVASGRCCAGAAVKLAKLARLLPAALMAPLPSGRDAAAFAKRHDLLAVSVGDILAYDQEAARSLTPVSDAQVPLELAEDTRIIAFRPGDGGIEHLALVIGQPDPARPVLVRLHSECFTGDLLGSLRCDCGDQLRGAIAELARAGGGLLLYMAQEGRGIGLVNKLRAYRLQDEGYDTLDANGQLGFDEDERLYLPAVEMLRQLGFLCVRLLTNNPGKVEALARHGIQVAERVPHVFPSNGHNEFYLRTKATKGGHIF
jgi:GTP cyclohydrolase II